MSEFITAADLVRAAKNLILDRYEQGRHHVATALRCNQDVYFGLHLDTQGIDTCGEPSAISAAIVAGKTRFDLIVSVHWTGNSGDEPTIITPCGNCRHLLLDIIPHVEVLVPKGNMDGYKMVTPASLLPYAYQKPT